MDYQKALEEVTTPGARAHADSAPPSAAEPGEKPEEEKPVVPAWVRELTELLREGRAFEEKEDYGRALKYYLKAQSVDPQCVEAVCYQGRIHVRLNDLSQAFKILERAYTMAPDNPEVLHSLGMAYAKSRDLKKAADLFKWAVDNDPGFARAHFDLGNLYMLLQERRKALDCFRKAVQLEPDNDYYRKDLEETEKVVRALDGAQEETLALKARLREAEEAAKAKYAADDEDRLEKSISDLILELTRLAGLENIKKEIKSLVKFLKVQRIRKEQGLPVDGTPLHAVFLGPPGTGKTTVARLLGRMLRVLGVLGKGHVIEVDRADLVGSSVRQMVEKTEKVIDSARHGILFIVDAYTLGNSAAVDIISRYMDEYKDTLMVIVSGESEKMQPFLETNPLLNSRFGRLFRFEYYQPRELTALFKTFSTEGGFRVDIEAGGVLLEYFKSVQPSKREVVGSSHYVRSFFQLVIRTQAVRISEMDLKDVTDHALTVITGRDIIEAIKQDTAV
jgi:tetratricopeptide (TPR) repeat protein